MHISTIMCKNLILLKTLLVHFWVVTHRVTVKNPATFDKKLAHLPRQKQHNNAQHHAFCT